MCSNEELQKELERCSKQLVRLQKHSFMLEGAIQMLEKLIAQDTEDENAGTE